MITPQRTPNLLALVMIVKNEARSIAAIIDSVRDVVDSILILDTGSTDGTQELAKKAFGDVPGEVLEEPFENYGVTRDRALDLAGTRCTFTLMLSGDETVVGAEALRDFCEQNKDSTGHEHGAYHLQLKIGGVIFDTTRLARSAAGWRYQGVVHEVMCPPPGPWQAPASIRVPGVLIDHDASHRDPVAMKRTWEQHLSLLNMEWHRRPEDPRTRFYLAQTCDCLGQYQEALDHYDARIAMGGWVEETFIAKLRAGRVANKLGHPWAEVMQRFLDAYSHSPHRAEPLYEIANHYYLEKNWRLCHLFALHAANISLPAHATLFVEHEIYSFSIPDILSIAAYYVGDLQNGQLALSLALAQRPDDPRLLKNQEFYRDRDGAKTSTQRSPR
jgi:hypothetical protein